MTLLDAILPSNRRAIFARCLDSRLRFAPQVIGGLPSKRARHPFWGAPPPTGNAGALGSWRAQLPRATKMRKPTSCINEREHPARFRVWMKNGHPQSVSSTFTCFVPMIDWERRWRKFENGDEPICVCEDAAREMGIVR
jgi:hypothetical protein